MKQTQVAALEKIDGRTINLSFAQWNWIDRRAVKLNKLNDGKWTRQEVVRNIVSKHIEEIEQQESK